MKKSKKWFIQFNEKYDQLHKELYLKLKENKISKLEYEQDLSKLPKKNHREYCSIELKWLSKVIRTLSCTFDIDGTECSLYFGLSIPWLFQFTVNLSLDGDYFKNKYPEIAAKEYNLGWGLFMSKEFTNFKWKYYEDYTCLNENRGTKIFFDNMDIIKGPNKHVWGEPKSVWKGVKGVETSYKLETYPDIPTTVNSKGREVKIIPLELEVYEVPYTTIYKRWFNGKGARYEVASSPGIVVPGKGENSWDCDDEIRQSIWDEDRKSANFSCGGCKNPEEAAQVYVNSIIKDLKR